MSNLREVLNTWDNADSELNKKIDNTNLSSIVASATASATNSKTVEINGTGKNVEKLVVEGKTVQDGTPTPSNPVEVKGVGDRTPNIFNINALKKGAIKASTNVIENADKVFNLKIANNKVVITTTLAWVGAVIEDYIPIKSSTTYVVSHASTNSTARIYFIQYDANKNVVKTVETLTSEAPKRITTEANVKYIRVSISFSEIVTNAEVSNIMIAEGTTVSYEPYGYKIPISSDGTTKNVYLDSPLFDGEKADVVGGVADKKYEIITLNGSEDWNKISEGTNAVRFQFSTTSHGAEAIMSDKFPCIQGSDPDSPHIRFGGSSNNVLMLWVSKSTATTVEALKTWLTSNNVTVVGKLATPTKETFEAVELPTSVGKNTLSVDTEVTPASVEAVTFGDYYSKSQIDKMFADVQADLAAMAELL